MAAASAHELRYYLRMPDGLELGPLSLPELRQALLLSGDPHPDYEVCAADDPQIWRRAAAMPELAVLFDESSLSSRTTVRETPSSKVKKRGA